ncbi:MAG: pyridoxal-phosphate dependent enzyme [Thermomicrobiales bacterium]
MEMPTAQEFAEARERIAGVALRTPLVPLHESAGVSDVYLKLEIHQPINSFKIRGIFNAVARLSEEERSRGLFTTSAGNTAQAIAWCGRYFGVEARSMMPHGAPRSKADAVRAYGGEPVFVTTDELFGYMRNRGWEGQDYAFIHPWTNRDVLIGHGSCGFEIAEDLPDVGTVYIPVGGGGFFCGVALALRSVRPDLRIVAVEPEGCPALSNSLAAGNAVSVDCQTFCDGVAVPYMTDENFPLLRDLADDCLLISEDEVFDAIRQLAFGNKVIAEGAGALAVAAATREAGAKPGPAVAIVTGGSIDPEKLLAILSGDPLPK